VAKPRPALTLTIIILLGTCLADSFAASESRQETELRGSVVRVEGRDVRIEITSQMWPRVGDTVRLGQTMPGLDGLAFMAGEWTVIDVTPDYVLAEAGPGVERTPSRGYLAIIQSASPQPRPAAGTGSGTGGPGTGVSGGTGGGGGSGDVFDEPIDLDLASALYEGLLAMSDSKDPSREEILQRARAGDPEAQNQLGVFFVDGVGVPQSPEEAAKWYRLAAEQDYPWSMTNLGSLYENGDGVPQDDIQAVYWYRRAAEQGFAIGQRRLGRMYQRGLGVPEDHSEAVRLYRLAADQGNAAANNDLGVMYAEGRGVAVDMREALRWFHAAAELGYDWGFANQAVIYERGLGGVPADRDLAIQNYQAAARLGHPGAQEWLRGQGLSW